MQHTKEPGAERILRLRLEADASSVPGARRFVAQGLRAWGHDGLVDDAKLCVSELAGNAALHASCTFIEVSVLERDGTVRLYVEDDGPTPAAAIAPRATLPGLDAAFDKELDDLEALLSAPATGRGLAIVSVLARDWGVEELESGKRVWAELSPAPAPAGAYASSAAATRDVRQGTVPPAFGDDALPEGWVVVVLLGCPVELSLRQDQHLDELVRELRLMSADRDNAESAELAERLAAILRAPAHARQAGREQVEAALRRGEDVVDLQLAMPRRFTEEVLLLYEAVCEADVLCEERRLLTLASTPEVRALRQWMAEQMSQQAGRGAAPVSWADWQTGRG